MDRAAIFVDAGYLFAAGAQALFDDKLHRHELRLDVAPCVAFLRDLAQRRTGLALLRIYWYDGVRGTPSQEHRTIAMQDDVKLRLGTVNSAGQQKGVDSLIVTDLIALARNRAIIDAVLIAGDEDLRIGVIQAQELGVRVHLVGVAPAAKNQSGLLREEADTRSELAPDDLRPLLIRTSAAVAPASVVLSIAATGATSRATATATAAARVAGRLDPDACRRVVEAWQTGSGIPADIDRPMLRELGDLLGAVLGPEDKRQARVALAEACRQRLV
ncbi:MAG: NYN domain-containing protein [Myxococcota bacterium]